MPDENGNLLPGDEGYVAPKVAETTETEQVTAAPIISDPVVEPQIAPDPTIEEAVPEPIIEDAVPAEDAYNQEPNTDPESYTVQAADLNAYPELSQQGVQLHNRVKYGSLYVWKKATAEGDGVVQDIWPRATGNEKAKGLTFKGE